MLHLEGQNYVMRGESSDFANRQKSIFDQLDAVKVPKQNETDTTCYPKPKKLMKTNEGVGCAVEDTPATHKRKRVDMKHFKGKESIFKRPEIPLPNRFRQVIPDFQRNPHKWKKYSLCDVSQDDMSDKSNTAAAMAFLNEIKLRKSKDGDEPMEIDKKIVFKHPNKPKSTSGPHIIQVSDEDSPGEDGTSYFKGSKLVMPEYVVGKKDQKKNIKISKDVNKNSSNLINKVKEIKLNHLIELDEGDDCVDGDDFNDNN